MGRVRRMLTTVSFREEEKVLYERYRSKRSARVVPSFIARVSEIGAGILHLRAMIQKSNSMDSIKVILASFTVF